MLNSSQSDTCAVHIFCVFFLSAMGKPHTAMESQQLHLIVAFWLAVVSQGYLVTYSKAEKSTVWRWVSVWFENNFPNLSNSKFVFICSSIALLLLAWPKMILIHSFPLPLYFGFLSPFSCFAMKSLKFIWFTIWLCRVVIQNRSQVEWFGCLCSSKHSSDGSVPDSKTDNPSELWVCSREIIEIITGGFRILARWYRPESLTLRRIPPPSMNNYFGLLWLTKKLSLPFIDYLVSFQEHHSKTRIVNNWNFLKRSIYEGFQFIRNTCCERKCMKFGNHSQTKLNARNLPPSPMILRTRFNETTVILFLPQRLATFHRELILLAKWSIVGIEKLLEPLGIVRLSHIAVCKHQENLSSTQEIFGFDVLFVQTSSSKSALSVLTLVIIQSTDQV